MLNKQQILETAKSDPRFAQAVLMIENKIGDQKIPPEVLNKMVRMLEMIANNPSKYKQIVQAAIKDGMIEEGMFPEQPDPTFVMSLLAVLYGMQERGARKFAKGGLAKATEQLRAKGRNDDSVLAHISPEEACVLKSRGGSGRINPRTGLPEFDAWSDFRDNVLKPALPLIVDMVVPGAGTALGTALGASGVWAPILGGAIMGGMGSALTGGNVAQGAMMGGLGGGLGNAVGGAASNAFGMGLGEVGKSVLGSGLVGAAGAALQGKNALQGGMQGAAGGYLGQQVGAMGGGNAAVSAGGQQFGNALTAGYDAKSAALQGGLTGLATAVSGVNPFTPKETPSDAVLGGLKGSVDPNNLDPYSLNTTTKPEGLSLPGSAPGLKAETSAWGPNPSAPQGGLFTAKNALLAATLLGGSGAPPEAQKAIPTLSPKQQEYFKRPNVTWDWTRMQNDATDSGMSLAQFMSSNWPSIAGYAQNGGTQAGAYNNPTQERPGYAMGGLTRYAQGAGSGRDDTIDAKLSDGEYVFDAETVALLGDGSNKEGAKRLDQMRGAIRAQKGQALAKGKISPNAKSPLAYLAGVK